MLIEYDITSYIVSSGLKMYAHLIETFKIHFSNTVLHSLIAELGVKSSTFLTLRHPNPRKVLCYGNGLWNISSIRKNKRKRKNRKS